MSAQKMLVVKMVESIPYGKVASYGQIGVFAQMPRGARQVGWILNSTERDGELDISWWRVVNNQGRISIKGSGKNTPALQKKLLEKESLQINDKLEFDIEKYRWKPTIKQLEALGLDPFYISHIQQKYPSFLTQGNN